MGENIRGVLPIALIGLMGSLFISLIVVLFVPQSWYLEPNKDREVLISLYEKRTQEVQQLRPFTINQDIVDETVEATDLTEILVFAYWTETQKTPGSYTVDSYSAKEGKMIVLLQITESTDGLCLTLQFYASILDAYVDTAGVYLPETDIDKLVFTLAFLWGNNLLMGRNLVDFEGFEQPLDLPDDWCRSEENNEGLPVEFDITTERPLPKRAPFYKEDFLFGNNLVK